MDVTVHIPDDIAVRLCAAWAFDATESCSLSERDSLLVLNLLENPPAPSAKLRAPIAALPKTTLECQCGDREMV